MMNRVGRLVRAEGIKLFAQPFLYVCLGLIGAGAILGAKLFALMQGRKPSAWGTLHAVQLFAAAWQFGALLSTFVLVIFSSMLFAGEFDRGTIKVLLTRPITRTELFLAKVVTVIGVAGVLLGFTLFVSLSWALGNGALGPVWDDTVYYTHLDASVIESHAVKAVGVGLLSFLAAGFLGLFVSTWTESSGFAVAIALVLFLFGYFVTGLLGGESSQEKLFFHYGPYAADKLKELAGGGSTRWSPRIVENAVHVKVPLYYIALFVPAAYGLFRSKNIHA